MAGIFDTQIFDTGIFDHFEVVRYDAGGGGGRRYWRWIAGKPSQDDVERVEKALKGKKKKPVEKKAAVILRAPARDVAIVQEMLPDPHAAVVAAMRSGLLKSLDSDELRAIAAQHEPAVNKAYVALLAVRKAKERAKAEWLAAQAQAEAQARAEAEEEAEAMEALLLLARRRPAMLAERALALMQRMRMN